MLTVSGDRPFALHRLDEDRLMPAGMRCDGVLVADGPPEGLVAFVELKGKLDPDRPERPFDQIRGAIEHFAPLPGGTAHGEEHHAAWRRGEDLPDAPHRRRREPLGVRARHAVAGVIVVSRGGNRLLPRWVEVAGRRVFIGVLQKHGTHNLTAVSLDDLQRTVENLAAGAPKGSGAQASKGAKRAVRKAAAPEGEG